MDSINGPTMAVFNIISSVGLIFCNKLLFQSYAFPYPLILTMCHFLSTLAAMQVLKYLGYIQPKPVRLQELIMYSALRVGSVTFMNFNLVYNNMGFYQLSKLFLTPTTILFQVVVYGETFSQHIYASLLVISMGIAFVQVSDPSINFFGTVIALLGVFTTCGVGLYQKYRVAPFGLNALELMVKQTPVESLFMGLLIPMIEPLREVAMFDFSPNFAILVMFSCIFAISVNVTSFLTVMKLSPVTYQVCGHIKTIFILCFNVALLHSTFTRDMALGCVLATFGIAYYMVAKSSPEWLEANFAGKKYQKVSTEA